MFTPDTIDEEVLNRLRAYYPGLAEMSDEALWVAFVKLWDKLMAMLCWSDASCNSLLDAERVMKVDLMRACFPLEILLNHKFVTSMVSVVIKWLTSSGFESITLPTDTLDNYLNGNTFYLILNQSQLSSINSCHKSYLTAELTYNAGLEEIPECFYSAIADALTISLCQQNNCFEGGEDCYALDRMALNARLKKRTIGDESWEWEVPNDDLINTIASMSSNGLLRILGQYNNCFNKIHFAA